MRFIKKKQIIILKGLERVDWTISRCTSPVNQRTIHFSKPGERERRHFISSIHCSFNCRRIGYLTVMSEAEFKLNQFIHTHRDLRFKDPGLAMDVEVAAQITLTAGPEQLTDDLVGTLTVVGYTVNIL